jgi:hypothetical protein
MEDGMNSSSRFVATVVIGGALALAACGGSDVSPVASTAAIASESGFVTSSGNGPDSPTSPASSPGTCASDCDGHGPGHGPGPGDGLCGDACTGEVGPDPDDIAKLLGETIQEEYRAEYLYRSVLQAFGPDTPPFALIAQAEARHVEALQVLLTRRQMTPPPSTWTVASFPAFASISEACAAGVAAEEEDAAFYTPHLQRDDLPRDVRNVFINLQRASLENHLPAFERCR